MEYSPQEHAEKMRQIDEALKANFGIDLQERQRELESYRRWLALDIATNYVEGTKRCAEMLCRHIGTAAAVKIAGYIVEDADRALEKIKQAMEGLKK